MKRWAGVILAVFALLLGSAGPSAAARGGGGGGGGHAGGGRPSGGHWGGGHWHGGHWHGGGGWWWPGAVVGGIALGAWATYPYYYPGYYGPYYGYPYDPYQVYVPPTFEVAEPQPQSAPVQREVVYPNGKYVLYGDGVTQPWQWVWVPHAPAPPSPPSR